MNSGGQKRQGARQIASLSLVLVLLLVFSISLASAFSLKDFFNKLSGKATYPTGNICTDTDSSDYFTKGFTSSTEWGRSFNYTDQCFTDTTLREYYCGSTGEAGARQYECAYGCRDGACLTQNECTDADGRDYNTQTVSFSIESGMPFRYVDECVSDADLREYYCASTIEMTAEIHTCPYGCREGKCKIASCTDTDNGADYSAQGSLTESKESGIIELTDECVNNTALREYYCADASSGEGTAKIYECPYGCEEGKCKIASCSDTDNGANETIRGTLSEFMAGNRTDFSDECVTSSLLREYYCSSTGEGTAKSIECAYGCRDGACLTSNECTDTDSGTAYNTRGRTYGYEFGRVFDNVDECVTDSLVRKYYCSSGQPTALTYDCPYGCKEGICITKDCNENDNGIDFYVAGTTDALSYGTTTSRSDECVSANTLNEYYCIYTADYMNSTLDSSVIGLNNNPGIDNITYDCANGCSNGACLPQLCNDTDRGLNYTSYGEVIDSEGNLYTDSCSRAWWRFWLPPTILTENYCEGNQPVNLKYTCPNGCEDGACLVDSENEIPFIDTHVHSTYYYDPNIGQAGNMDTLFDEESTASRIYLFGSYPNKANNYITSTGKTEDEITLEGKSKYPDRVYAFAMAFTPGEGDYMRYLEENVKNSSFIGLGELGFGVDFMARSGTPVVFNYPPLTALNEVEEMLDFAAENNLIVLLHTQNLDEQFQMEHEEIDWSVLERHRNVTFLAPHAIIFHGYKGFREDLNRELSNHCNLYFDFAPENLKQHFPDYGGTAESWDGGWSYLFNKLPDRFVIGSDEQAGGTSKYTSSYLMAFFDSLDVNEEKQKKIMYQNAIDLAETIRFEKGCNTTIPVPECGNGVCEAEELLNEQYGFEYSCPEDCCGDGSCDWPESVSNPNAKGGQFYCLQDCG